MDISSRGYGLMGFNLHDWIFLAIFCPLAAKLSAGYEKVFKVKNTV